MEYWFYFILFFKSSYKKESKERRCAQLFQIDFELSSFQLLFYYKTGCFWKQSWKGLFVYDSQIFFFFFTLKMFCIDSVWRVYRDEQSTFMLWLYCQLEILTFKQHHDHRNAQLLGVSLQSHAWVLGQLQMCTLHSEDSHWDRHLKSLVQSVYDDEKNIQRRVEGTAWRRNLLMSCFPVFCSSSTKSHLWKSRVDTERDYPWDQVQRRRQDPLQLCNGICFGGACSAHMHSEPREWCIVGFPCTIL